MPIAPAIALLGLLLSTSPTLTDAAPSSNLCVNVSLHPNGSNLPNASLNQAYAQPLWVTPANVCIPVIWTVSPPLPPNLTLVSTGPNSAVIAGVPLATGTYTFTVTAQATHTCGTVCFLSHTSTLVVQ